VLTHCALYTALQGGTGELIAALVRGIEKRGGTVELQAHVDSITVANGRAAGVSLRGGRRVTASKAVVSNASIWDTLRLVSRLLLCSSMTIVARVTDKL
jgi:phytoene dehydrogenase-like protein